MRILKFLHILFMFGGVGMAVGSEIVLHRVMRKRDVRLIREVFGLWQPIGNFVPLVFVVGLGFGLATIASGGLDWTAPWLIIAYVLFGLDFALNIIWAGPWFGKVTKAAAEAPDGPMTPELIALAHDKPAMFASVASYVILVLLIADMVLKPFS